MNELDVIESMYVEAEREDNIIIIPINNNFKIYLELLDKDIVFDVLPSGTFSNTEIVRKTVDAIVKDVKELLNDNYLYDIIELVSDYLNSVTVEFQHPKFAEFTSSVQILDDDNLPLYVSSEKFTVKRSTFIAHVCTIDSQADLSSFVNHIHNKFPEATHHIVAYCISFKDMDYDDDGEDGAGHRVLFMMKANKLTGCAVIISRWFGGVKLGPSRFKIITNVARQLLEDQGWIKKSN